MLERTILIQAMHVVRQINVYCINVNTIIYELTELIVYT